MLRSKNIPLLGLLAFSGALLAGCGGNPPPRYLQSLTVSAATLPAAQGSNYSIQYTATAHWSAAPFTTADYPANWVACNADDSAPTSDVTVTQKGLATCGSSASGIYTINAWTVSNGAPGTECNHIDACGGGCMVRGSASLNCSLTVHPAG